MMAVQTIQPHHYHMLTYRGEHIQFVRSFKYLGIDVSTTNKWSACFDSRLQAGWKSYYLLENQCNQSDTCGWEVTNVVQCYGNSSIALWSRSMG